MPHLSQSVSTIQHILAFNCCNNQRIFYLDQVQYSIGRHPHNDIVINANGISRQHATLVQATKTAEIVSFVLIDGDLQGNKSRNGILINGERKDKYELKHGDIIQFSETVKAHYYIVNKNSEYFLNHLFPNIVAQSTGSDNQNTIEDTQLIIKNNQDKQYSSTLSNLASVVELSPIPIIEINGIGQITYLNSAASLTFPDLQQAKLNHPLLQGLIEQNNHHNGNLLIREVNLKTQSFEQHIHYLSTEKLIRSYIFDITKRKAAEENLKYQAFHDTLTKLPNRIFFNQQLALALKTAKRYNKLLAVLFLDLDGFKNINDTLGHGIGDRVLECFAQRLSSQIRESDLVCRWGGDEFTVLLSDIKHPDEAAKFARRLLKSFIDPLTIGKHQLYLKSSIGIAIYPQDGEQAETLIKHADIALYRAKEWGRNHYQFYSSQMSCEVTENFRLENQLHRAIKNQEFVLHYQPRINIRTGKIYGVEALIRWQNRDLGLVKPDKFITCAEKTGLILPIGEWVLHTACQQNKYWQKIGLPPIRVAVNLSPQQFQQPNLVEMVEKTLKLTGLEPKWLELEVTESTLIHNVTSACQTLKQLQEMGIYISMDDFGTGYSSLSYLKKFPFHTLKIDQSFIKELQNNSQDLAIISAVITLSRGLNMSVVAEGVETQAQLDLLKKLQCEEMQGYFFSHPLSSQDILQYLISFYQKQNYNTIQGLI